MKLCVKVVERTIVNDKATEKPIADAVSEHQAPAGIDAAVAELAKRAQGKWEAGKLRVGIHVLVGDDERPVLYHEVSTTRDRGLAFVVSWKAFLRPPKKAPTKPKAINRLDAWLADGSEGPKKAAAKRTTTAPRTTTAKPKVVAPKSAAE